MFSKRNCFLLVLILSLSQHIFAQGKFPGNREDKLILEEAELWFAAGDYKKAEQYFKVLEEKYPAEAYVQYRLGLGQFYLDGASDEVINRFKKADDGTLAKTEFPFYYGQVLHMHYNFKEAIVQFEQFLNSKSAPKELKEETKRYIENCENGIVLMNNPVPVTIKNIGPPVNTEYSEYVPLISADESVLLFTYRGIRSVGGLQMVDEEFPDLKEYHEDVMMTFRDSAGNWLEPLLLQSNINTPGNDACVAISPDAQHMYLFRSIEADPGTIYKCELDGLTWTDPEKLSGDINSKAWEGSITITPDGKTVYFASERPGGKGGRDLYTATLQPDGSWANVKNLGSTINTKYDDDAPFIHPGGKYLAFSSQGHNSMGGFDIFISERTSDSSWTEPKNIGYPINTPRHDKFYSVSADGLHGYYSSGKPGKVSDQDIYLVEPGLIDAKVVLAQVKGKVTLDGQPVEATIEVRTKDPDAKQSVFASNSLSGRYLIDLIPGYDYKLIFRLDEQKDKVYEVEARNITGFVERIINVAFITGDTATETPKDTTPQIVYKDTAKSEILTTRAQMLEKAGSYVNPDLNFMVQIGAYRFPKNFKYDFVLSQGGVEQNKLQDNITRFTMDKRFKTLKDAHDYKDVMVKTGVSDAFVTSMYKGQRYLLVDLFGKILPAEGINNYTPFMGDLEKLIMEPVATW